jgi:hypothetical protein
MRPNGLTATLKVKTNATAESRRTNGVQIKPKPIVDTPTPAIGMNTSRGMPKVRDGFSSTRG